MTLYKSILKESWRTTIHNKYLWFFGLFSVLLGNGGEYEVFFNALDREAQSTTIWSGFLAQLFEIIKNIPGAAKLIWTDPVKTFEALGTILFILIIFAFVYWMMNISQIAIVNAVSKEQRQKDHSLALGLAKGHRHFWAVFTLNTVLKVIIFLALWLIARTATSYLSIVLIIILVPVVMAISFVAKFAIAYVIIRKEKLVEALKSSSLLFRKNWIVSLEIAFFLYLFTILAGIVFVLIAFNIKGFYSIVAGIFPALAFDLYMKLLPLTMFVALAFIGSLLSVFQISSWTKLFMELDNKGARSKIERVFEK